MKKVSSKIFRGRKGPGDEDWPRFVTYNLKSEGNDEKWESDKMVSPSVAEERSASFMR